MQTLAQTATFELLLSVASQILKVEAAEDYNLSYDENQKILCIAFKGTTNISRWITNFRTGNYYGFHKGYFMEALRFLNEILEVCKTQNPAQIHLAGHSSGGAIASILCVLLRRLGYCSYCYTFGAPKISAESSPYHYICDFISVYDAVPFLNTKFERAGKSFLLDGKEEKFILSSDFLDKHSMDFYFLQTSLKPQD